MVANSKAYTWVRNSKAKPLVSDEIQKRIKARAEKLNITHEMVLAELAKTGFANMGDYVKIGEDGLPRTDFSNLTQDQMAAIQEITVDQQNVGTDETPEVNRVKFKLGDKRQNLVDIGKHIGMFDLKVGRRLSSHFPPKHC